MPYLLDANIVSDIIRHPSRDAARRLRSLGELQVRTSIVVAAELKFGAEKVQSSVLARKIDAALDRMIVLPLRPPVDDVYARIRSQVERAGTPIGANDLLIASQAIALDLVLVTDNVREFSRIEGLHVENWLREDETS